MEPKNLDEIKSKKETLICAERLYNNRDNVIRAFENRIFPFKDGFQKKEPDMSDIALPKWVKVGKKRLNRIKSKFQNAKDNNVQADHLISSLRSNQLIRDIWHNQVTYEEALKRIAIIHWDIDTILSQKRLRC